MRESRGLINAWGTEAMSDGHLFSNQTENRNGLYDFKRAFSDG